MNLQAGMEHTVRDMVTEALTARAVGSGTVQVYATPMMVALMERAAAECVQGALEPGQVTVGTQLAISHLGATPVGMAVRATAVVTAVEGRTIHFRVSAWDEVGEIGAGTHSRVIVDRERFQQKAEAKGK